MMWRVSSTRCRSVRSGWIVLGLATISVLAAGYVGYAGPCEKYVRNRLNDLTHVAHVQVSGMSRL